MKKIVLPSILEKPVKPYFLSDKSKWIAGEGAGSWFDFYEYDIEKALFEISRYSPEGELECRGIYELKNGELPFLFHSDFELTYPSNCQKVTIKQLSIIYEFKFLQLC